VTHLSVTHLGDEAELYALGLLDDAEREAVDAHVATCEGCARRVGDAEDVAATLAASIPASEPPARLGRRFSARAQSRTQTFDWRIAALSAAAAILLAFSALSWQRTTSVQGRLATMQIATQAMLRSHFTHVPMTLEPGAATSAKVIYDPKGTWIYVVALDPADRFDVVARSASGERDLGALSPSGETSVLFAPQTERVESVELRRGASTVARGNLRY